MVASIESSENKTSEVNTEATNSAVKSAMVQTPSQIVFEHEKQQ